MVTILPTNQPAQQPPLVLSAQSTAPTKKGVTADFLVNNIPFLLSPSDQYPYERNLTEDQKQQFDASQEAGEQSFGAWWLRAQSTFHGGQGEKYLDSSDASTSRLQFWESSGVDVHVPGEATILGALTTTAVSYSKVLQVTWNGQQKLVALDSATNAIHVSNLPDGSGAASYTIGTAGVGADMCTDGSVIWIAINDKIYRVTPGVSTPTIVETHIVALSGPVVLGFAKSRLLLCVGNVMYELDPNPPGPPVTVTSLDIHFTNPAANYVYTSIVSGPLGIFSTGNSGPRSDLSLMNVTVDPTLGVQLGPPTEQFNAPPGELIQSILFYVSGFFVLATTAGARVGTFTAYGQPQPGLLLIKRPCYSLSASGTLVYVGAQDSVWVIDLSTAIDQQGSYAHYQYADGVGVDPDDTVRSVTILPGVTTDPDLVFGVTKNGNLITQPAYAPATAATLTTAWARFDTTEPKRLYYLDVDGTFPVITGVSCVCCVQVESLSGETQMFHITGGSTHYEFGLATLTPDQAFRVTFQPHDTGTGNGVAIRSWQFKARPAEKIYSEITLPFALQDQEMDASGSQTGYPGYARKRLTQLEALVGANSLVTVTDVHANTAFQATVKQCQFIQSSQPTVQQPFGGVVNIVFRLV